MRMVKYPLQFMYIVYINDALLLWLPNILVPMDDYRYVVMCSLAHLCDLGMYNNFWTERTRLKTRSLFTNLLSCDIVMQTLYITATMVLNNQVTMGNSQNLGLFQVPKSW